MEDLKRARCPNILPLYESFEDVDNYYTVTKYMRAGSLENYLRYPRSESSIKRIIRQLSQGLQGMHAQNIVHRDIKPNNIMLSDNTDNADVCIGDFGSAFKLQSKNETCNFQIGTKGFIAPEMIKG